MHVVAAELAHHVDGMMYLHGALPMGANHECMLSVEIM